MSDYASAVDRARSAFASVSRLEDALARAPERRDLQSNLVASLNLARKSQDQLYQLAQHSKIEVCNYRLMPETSKGYGVHYVAKSLLEYQNLFAQIHDAKKTGPKQRAVIGREAFDESTLEIAYTYSGSLGVVFLAQSERDLIEGKLDASIKTLFEVVDLDSRAAVREIARELGPPVIKRVHDWSDANLKGGFAADVRWNRSDGHQLGEVIPRKRMEIIVELVEATADKVTKEFPITGYLIGGHLETQSFHLAVPNGESYRGYRAKDFYSEVDMTLGKMYAAVIRETTTLHYATEKIEKKEELVRLMRAPEGSLLS
jgi:hypothetical protein